MKFNQWTLALAAIGAVSIASAVRAEELTKQAPVETALSNTTLSGSVDVAAQYNMGNYSTYAGVPAGTSPSKVDNFSLNNVDIALDKPQDESPWASGYHVDLNAGTDAVGVGLNGSGSKTTSAAAGTANVALRNAYIALRTPVGNGIDWKVGVQDDIIGYEGNTDAANPNYTRSIGYSVEPTTLLGLIGSYKIVDAVTVQAGLADATTYGMTDPLGNNYNGLNNSSDKTAVAAIAFTAPDSFGWAKGATLTLGTLMNVEPNGQDNYYAGLTLPTPISALKFGVAYDLVSDNNKNVDTNSKNDSGWVLGVYGTYQATDKLSFNLRGEYFDLSGVTTYSAPNYTVTNGKGEELTATIQYNLWANVISRVEFRWDHVDSGNAFANKSDTGSYPNGNSFLVAANLIYSF